MKNSTHNSSATARAGAPIVNLTASEIASAVNARSLTCETVVRACLERIA